MPTNKQDNKKEMNIADYKIAMMKQGNRYKVLITAILSVIVGIIIGYFVSINVTGDIRASVLNELNATALKDQ